METTNLHLTYVTKFSYGVGHVFNDLCSSMWFSYLLIFFEKVLRFSKTHSGLILLVGQLADGISTPFVGIFSDKENKIAACARYGRRKVWHLMGTIFVLLSFPFIFSKCVGCQDADERLQMVYYCFFVILFQFGWASVQISHLALIPELTSKKHNRTELNSIRYAFTVLSSLSVYTIAFLLFKDNGDNSNSSNAGNYSSYTTTMMTPTTTDMSSGTLVCPQDANNFRNMALFCICTGSIFSAIFHIGVKEPPFTSGKKRVIQSNGKGVTVHRMKILDWFKEISFYQVAVLYMATRLFVNLYQVYIPIYVQDTLHLEKETIATVPFVMYLAGFIGSLVMKKVNKIIGRKGAYATGSLIGLAGCISVAFDYGDAYKVWGIYIVAAVLGIGGSTVLITSLSVTADLIGNNVEGGAFVYGFMSLMDKISNGVVVMIIQSSCETKCNPEFYQHVITYACGSACLLGFIMILTLIPVKIGKRRGVARSIASLFSNEEEEAAVKKLQSLYNGAMESQTSSNKKPEELNDKQNDINHKLEVICPPLREVNQNIEEGNPKLEDSVTEQEKVENKEEKIEHPKGEDSTDVERL
ncbi:Major facilitator superfamily domain-containing protein 12 [Armadillidium nasatum]|uniref:Major facilitator superfamily domain-containing protein 12 n=1 Tax=Armadillidium nasatum TaxID=96803 RepID=A0A5N5SPA0_9CRUS|nr:Major facilitator superfamily domain-containing protein 12 [Armadillidium nasatum]